MITQINETIEKLHHLRLDNMADYLADALDQEKENNRGFLWLLDYLIGTENEARWKRAIENRFRNAHLLDKFLLSDFDFKFHP